MDSSPAQDLHSNSDWIARVRSLRPLIEAASARTEVARQLAPEVLEALHATGLFRLLIPRDLGGVQLDLPAYVQVIEALAEADASVAWCVGQGCGCSLTAAYLPGDAAWSMSAPTVARCSPGDRGRAGRPSRRLAVGT